MNLRMAWVPRTRRVSFIANSIVKLNAAASFYGGGIAPALLDRAARQNGPLLLFWGGLDKHIGEEQRREVRDALTTASKPFIDTPVRAARHGQHCRPVAKYAHRYIVAARAQAAYQAKGVAPVAPLRQRFRTPPDIRVIGNNIR